MISEKRVRKAAVKYFQRAFDKDADHLGTIHGFEVFNTNDGLVFCYVVAQEGSFPEYNNDEVIKQFESAAILWCGTHDEPLDVQVTCDVIQVAVASKDRAFLKHLHNLQPEY